MKTPYQPTGFIATRIIYSLFTCLCLCLALNSFAEERRQYNIEVIIFKYNQPSGFNAESWPENWSLPDIENSHEVFGKPVRANIKQVAPIINGQFLDGAQNSKPRKKGFRRLAYSAFELKEEAKKLNKSSRYTILKHVAWKQPGLPAKQAIPIRIRGGNAYDIQSYNSNTNLTYEIDGTIKVVLGRYLHVYTDLLYTQPVVQVAKSKISADEEDGAPEKIIYETILTDAEQDNATLYGFSIKQHRRMRSKKLHHIDHPLVGVLVYATPVQAAEKVEQPLSQ